MMGKLCSTFIFSVFCFSAAIADYSTAIADTTVGFGVGTLYNGLGVNFGLTSDVSLAYGSLGCMGVSRSDDSVETNCGVGLGYINMQLLPGENHGLGLTLGYTSNSIDTAVSSGVSEYHLMAGYHYFLNKFDQRGLNLGFGARVTRNVKDATETGLTFNLGYQL